MIYAVYKYTFIQMKENYVICHDYENAVRMIGFSIQIITKHDEQ